MAMKKIILPVVLLAIGAGIAAAASFAAKKGDCCQAAKRCCEVKGDCCKGVPAAADEKDCCRPVQECCEAVADCCGPVTGIESAEK